MDTGNDPRFRVLEAALDTLTANLQQGRLKAPIPRRKALDAVEAAHRALPALRYSYLDADGIRALPAFADLLASADELEAILGGPGFRTAIREDALAVAEAGFALDQIRSLGARLDLPEGYEAAVEAAAGRVVSVSPLPDAPQLHVTHVVAGRPLTVVTNDPTVGKDDHVGVALLPPRRFHGLVSDAMFLGVGGGVLRGIEEGPGGRPVVPDEAWKAARGILGAYLEGRR